MRSKFGFIALVLCLFALVTIVIVLHSQLSEIEISEPAAPAATPKPLVEEMLIEPDEIPDTQIQTELVIPDLVKTAEEAVLRPPAPDKDPPEEVTDDVPEELDEAAEKRPSPAPPAKQHKTRTLPSIPVFTNTPPSVIPAVPQPLDDLSVSAVIIQTSGRVNITRNGRRMPGQSGFELEEGDAISTDRNSRARVRFSDGTVLGIGENTEIKIDEYIYTPDMAENCSISLRFIRGMGRLVTGAITRMRPEGLRVSTQMATIGVRGCNIAVSSSADRVDIYIIDLPPGHEIDVNATVDGRPVINMLTGDELVVPDNRKDQQTVTESLRIVSVIRGAGMTSRPMTGRDLQYIEGQIVTLQPTRYQLFPTAD